MGFLWASPYANELYWEHSLHFPCSDQHAHASMTNVWEIWWKILARWVQVTVCDYSEGQNDRFVLRSTHIIFNVPSTWDHLSQCETIRSTSTTLFNTHMSRKLALEKETDYKIWSLICFLSFLGFFFSCAQTFVQRVVCKINISPPAHVFITD